MLNASLGDFPSFWQNLMFARSNCDIFDFRHWHLTAVHNRGRSSACTVCKQLPLAVTRDQLTRQHIVPQPIHLRPVHELIDCGSMWRCLQMEM
jgi:hypothetical protein